MAAVAEYPHIPPSPRALGDMLRVAWMPTHHPGYSLLGFRVLPPNPPSKGGFEWVWGAHLTPSPSAGIELACRKTCPVMAWLDRRESQGLTGHGVTGERDMMATAHTRVGVALTRVGVAPARVGVAHTRVGVAHTRVGVAPARVGVAHAHVGVAHARVGVAHTRVGVAYAQ